MLLTVLYSLCIIQPDEIEGKIREIVPAGFTCNTDDFISRLEKEANFRPFGTLLHTYTVHNEEAGELTYQIHKVHRGSHASPEIHENFYIFVSALVPTFNLL